MDFRLTEQQRELQDAARAFAVKELPDLAREMEAKDFLEALLVLEQFAMISNAVAFPVFEALVGPVRTVDRFGSGALKERIIPQVVRGEATVAVSMSEPDAGTALTDLSTRAREDGDHYILDGSKRWTSGAGHARYYVVYCRLSDAPGAKGVGALLVDKDMPGVGFGKREELMGFRGIETRDIAFDAVRVPQDNLIVGAGGFGKLMSAFGLERCGNATQSLGLAAGALEQATAYVQERTAFGKPIVDFQAVQLRLADMAMRVEAARLLIYRAAANAAHEESRLPSVYESSIAKCFANEIVRQVTADAMQVMGGYGYHKEYGMEQRVRDGFAWGIAGGTTDVQKTNIAASLVGRRFDQRR